MLVAEVEKGFQREAAVLAAGVWGCSELAFCAVFVEQTVEALI